MRNFCCLPRSFWFLCHDIFCSFYPSCVPIVSFLIRFLFWLTFVFVLSFSHTLFHHNNVVSAIRCIFNIYLTFKKEGLKCFELKDFVVNCTKGMPQKHASSHVKAIVYLMFLCGKYSRLLQIVLSSQIQNNSKKIYPFNDRNGTSI